MLSPNALVMKHHMFHNQERVLGGSDPKSCLAGPFCFPVQYCLSILHVHIGTVPSAVL